MAEGERFGAYEVHERLGAGGMATVHRARFQGSGAEVALKRLLPQLSTFPEFVQSFLAEARLARLLRHGNVAATYDFGQVGDTYYIAMELVRGPTLAELLNRCIEVDRVVPLPIALAIVSGLCDALGYAHGLADERGAPLGIVHRDVTPSNIIISDAGVPKLIDFGIAKATSNEVRTKTGFIKGKFGYVAPEYIAGRIDARADLFAAGIVTHELLARRRLFQVANEIETLQRARALVIEPPSRWNAEVPPALDAVVMRALERDPERRWQTAGEMGAALAEVGPRATAEELAHWVSETMAPRRDDPSLVVVHVDAAPEPIPPRRLPSIVALIAAGVIATLLIVALAMIW
jgi:eukaryotic-like serine/threonine-protein kinase